MKINENTLLEGHKVVLIPYNPKYLPRYHEWMKCPELQHLTASEPLTLEQEYDMQGSWREDDDSKTSKQSLQWADPSIEEEQCMVGDVNIHRGTGIGKEMTHMMMHYGEHLIPSFSEEVENLNYCPFFAIQSCPVVIISWRINLWWSRKNNKCKIAMRMQTAVDEADAGVWFVVR
uniref:Uncharacterized protein n=1 Tax=Monopterus albus TaxID=43700 RepID=A0A3Q3IU31_MONAL